MTRKNEEEISLWSDTVPGLRVVWDATSLNAFETCPRLFQLAHAYGWVPKRRAPALHFGISFHAALDTYERQKAEGKPHLECIREALRRGFTEWGEFQSDDNRRTKFTLARAIIWYADRWIEDPAKTVTLANGKPAVELSFRTPLPLLSPDNRPYIVCGHLDRIATLGENTYVLDAKTTVSTLSSTYFGMYDLDVQMDLYDFFGRVVLPETITGLMVDGVQTAVNFTRFERWFSNRKGGCRDEWLEDTLFWIELAEDCAIKNSWPMNKTSCSKFGGCRFREVCKREPSVRHAILDSDFKVEHWNPLRIRGED